MELELACFDASAETPRDIIDVSAETSGTYADVLMLLVERFLAEGARSKGREVLPGGWRPVRSGPALKGTEITTNEPSGTAGSDWGSRALLLVFSRRAADGPSP